MRAQTSSPRSRSRTCRPAASRPHRAPDLRWLLALTLAGCAFDGSGLTPPGDAGGALGDAPAPADAPAIPAADAPIAPDGPAPLDARPPDARPVDARPPDAPCADGDGDTVCDAVDRCALGDDRLDADGDGTPDACDPCPLDDEIADLIPLPAIGDGITIFTANLDLGFNVKVVPPGGQVTLSLTYAITDCACTTCRDQIEIGLVPGSGVAYCAYDGVPGCTLPPKTGSSTRTLTAPTTPGVYYIRFGMRQDYGCGTEWWHGTPPPGRTLGALCVR